MGDPGMSPASRTYHEWSEASSYRGAALWLTRARTAYDMLGRNDVWNAYLDELLERHTHKSKLLPLLRALQEGT
jgi:uncharacterized Zn finger protein